MSKTPLKKVYEGAKKKVYDQLEQKKHLLEAVEAFDVVLDDNQKAIDLLELTANMYYDGHYTIFKFTTHYKVMLGTPDFDSGDFREMLNWTATGESDLKHAIMTGIQRAFMDLHDEWDTDAF